MIAVHFDKAYADKVFDALNSGKPIPPLSPTEWSRDTQLMLAGLLYAGVFCEHEQSSHEIRDISSAAATAMDSEQREAIPVNDIPRVTEETFRRDIRNGIEYVGNLTLNMLLDQYDDQFEPVLAAVLSDDGDGHKKVYPGKGFKNVG